MAGGAAFWIRTENPVVDREAIQGQVGAARDAIAEARFIRVENDDRMPRELLRSLSSTRHTDVIWMSARDGGGGFEYAHFQHGALVREIAFAATWEKLDGAPEPWERWKPTPKLGKPDPRSVSQAAEWVCAHFGLRQTDGLDADTVAATPRALGDKSRTKPKHKKKFKKQKKPRR